MHENFKKIQTINLGIYPFNIHFFLLSKKGIDLMGHGGGKCSFNKETQDIFIYLSEKSISIMVHEIFHAVEFIMKKIGEDINEDTVTESWAYLIGYLTKQGIAFLGSKVIH